MQKPSLTPTTDDARNWFRGFLMGAADIIPGVSGGTVALILGIYHRLVTAISHIDSQSLDLLRKRELTSAAERVDLRFLCGLGVGILSGVVLLAGVMHTLLIDHTCLTYACFFGLIFASCWLVAVSVTEWNIKRYSILCFGVLGMFLVVSQNQVETPPDSLLYTFCCGAVAICAMILPGISGAFILLLLGKYAEITGLIKAIPKLEATPEEIWMVAVFCAGCLVGLLSFCRLLKKLLANHEQTTLALLCGLMIGSLNKLWPFKEDLTPNEMELKYKQYENVSLSEVTNQEILSALLVASIAFAAVLMLDRWSRGSQQLAEVGTVTADSAEKPASNPASDESPLEKS